MKEENFCKLFIFALLNLTCFLLSTVFLTSTYNIKDQSYFLLCHDSEIIYKKYVNHYKGISALFSLNLLSFLAFFIALIILIKKDKMDSENEYQDFINNYNFNNNFNIEINQINFNYNNNNILNFESERVIGYDNNNNNQNNQRRQREQEDSIIQQNKDIVITIIISFILCQIFYAIELFVLSSYHYKSKNFEKEYKCEQIKDLTNIYTALIVIGYIFLFIYIIFYIYLLILYNKFGESAKTRLDNFTKSKYCECCNNCIIKGCQKCTECFKSKTDEELEQDNRFNRERIQQSTEQKLEYIRQLEVYKQNLENINSRIANNENINDNELKRLNLERFNLDI